MKGKYFSKTATSRPGLEFGFSFCFPVKYFQRLKNRSVHTGGFPIFNSCAAAKSPTVLICHHFSLYGRMAVYFRIFRLDIDDRLSTLWFLIQTILKNIYGT